MLRDGLLAATVSRVQKMPDCHATDPSLAPQSDLWFRKWRFCFHIKSEATVKFYTRPQYSSNLKHELWESNMNLKTV